MMANKLLRVTQMNAIFLDTEIHNALMRIIQDIARVLPPGYISPIEPEINLVVKLLLLKNSIWKSGSTFGQHLLSIKYSNISTLKKILYILANSADYIVSRLEHWRPSHKINSTVFKCQLVVLFCMFLNTSVFLQGGVKPLLIERLLCLNQEYSTEATPRYFDSKYLTRELLWNGFIDILVYMLPLINYHKIRRTVRHYNPFHKKPTYVFVNNHVITMHSRCAHCGENPILPHHMGCAHIFCYVCLKGNQTADSKYECPICEHQNQNLLCDKVSVI